MKILVVDDAPEVVESVRLGFTLQWREVEVIGAGEGERALDLVEQEAPDLVLLDVGLPDLDGYQVARRIREQPGFADLPLIAMTGYGQEEDRRRSAAAGFDHHLVKPVDFDSLVSLIGLSASPQ